MIEAHDSEGWVETRFASWANGVAYRIRPEPKRETVVMNYQCGQNSMSTHTHHGDTHRITFTTTDGTPDLDSVKMEEV